jgi:hopanoid biosynthesis associated protein HpnK
MGSIIITADDFGLSEDINEAVERAHRDGVLTSASLMVGAPAAQDAIARARKLPALKVGLHVVLVQGVPVLPRSEVPALLGRDGRFPDNLTLAGLKWFFSPASRRQLRREVAAQFTAFRATGLALDHVNAHNHMHLHPTALSAILAELTTDELNATPPVAVRLPREPWSASLRGGSSVSVAAMIERGIMAPWLGLMEYRLKRRGIPHNHWLFGLAATGRMNEATLLQVIDTLPKGVVEIYCHPATRRAGAITNSMSGYDNEGEFNALVSGRVRTRIVERRLRVGGFTDVCRPA